MSEDDVMQLLRRRVADAGGQRAFAKTHKFSAAYVNDVLHKRRGLADKICAAIGIKRIVIYSANRGRSRA